MTTRFLAALAALLGLQAMRALLPLLVYVLRDRFGWPVPLLGAVTLVFFVSAGVAPLSVRRFGPRRVLGGAVALLALSRGLLQLWPGDPWVALVFAALSVQAFLLAVAALSLAPSGSGGWCAGPVPPFLFGALVDAAIHALAGTRDLHWSGGLLGAAALGPCLLAGGLALRVLARPGSERADGSSLPGALAAFAWGPFLTLHLEWFGNVARLSARTALDTGPSGQMLILGLATGFALACRVAQARQSLLDRIVPAAAALALFLCSLRATSTGAAALAALWIGQCAGAVLLARAVGSSPRGRAVSSGRAWGLAYGGGLAVFVLLLLAHYGGYDLPLALGKTGAHAVAAVLLAWAALRSRPRPGAGAIADPAAARKARPSGQAAFLLCWATAILIAFVPGLRKPPPTGVAIVRPVDSALLTQVLLAGHLSLRADTAPLEHALGAGDAGRFRVASFNLHNGFDERGGFGFDAMMAKVAAESLDVIAFQEVSRGWLINGGADLLVLARETLPMYAVSGPTADSDWGNAVFTRIPPTGACNIALPPESLALARAVTVVDLPWDAPRPLGANEAGPARVRVLATHFHHRKREGEIREEQARAIVEAVPATEAELLLGDFNALPDSQPLRILVGAGWQDVAGPDANRAEARTNPSREPTRRIDTILFRGSLKLLSAAVAPPWGSDHRAVIADFAPAELWEGSSADAVSAGTPAPADERGPR
jgi:endonuclease/exonuclease/phosphatase family metal-dependent hydrolase